MRGNGGRIQEWIKYAALFVLAVAAVGVAAIAPAGSPDAGEAGSCPFEHVGRLADAECSCGSSVSGSYTHGYSNRAASGN